MATYVPPKRATAFRCWLALVSRSTRPQFQTNPTLAAGDVQVSKDGGALANLTTLPAVTPAGSALIQVDLSAAEMTADNVTVIFRDAAGAEWDDLVVNIATAARQIDDLSFPATAGRSMVVDAAGLVDATVVKVGPTGAGTAQTAGDIMADTNDIQARLPAALVGGRIDASVGAMAADVVTAAAVANGAIDAATFAAGAVDAAAFAQAAADKVWATAARALTDKVGFALTAGEEDAIANKVWDELTAEGRTGGSYGLLMQAIAGYIDTEVAAIKAKTDNLPAAPAATGDQMALTAAAIDLIHDDAFEGALTFRQLARIILAAVAGKSNGFPAGPAHYRDQADAKNRITATVDADGNRSVVTVDGT